jgi:hypothetical protein
MAMYLMSKHPERPGYPAYREEVITANCGQLRLFIALLDRYPDPPLSFANGYQRGADILKKITFLPNKSSNSHFQLFRDLSTFTHFGVAIKDG